MTARPVRFPIRFDTWYRPLSWSVLIPPAQSYLDVFDDHVEVKMAWAFRASFPRSAVRSTSVQKTSPISRGVHGFDGRWLVNGAGDRVLAIDLDPAQRGRVMGIGVSLRQLMVSVDDPAALAAALQRS